MGGNPNEFEKGAYGTLYTARLKKYHPFEIQMV